MLNESLLAGYFGEIEKIAASRWKVEARRLGYGEGDLARATSHPASREKLFSGMQRRMGKPTWKPWDLNAPVRKLPKGEGFKRLPGAKPPKVPKPPKTPGRIGRFAQRRAGGLLGAALFLPGMISAAKEKVPTQAPAMYR